MTMPNISGSAGGGGPSSSGAASGATGGKTGGSYGGTNYRSRGTATAAGGALPAWVLPAAAAGLVLWLVLRRF